jgi:hypothetical protein
MFSDFTPVTDGAKHKVKGPDLAMMYNTRNTAALGFVHRPAIQKT